MRAATVATLLSLLLAGLGGCASRGPTTFRAPAGEYGAAFDAVRDEIRSAGFELDRVDARAGVISSYPKWSGGLATPWISHESTFGDEWAGLLNHQQRRVLVQFLPEGEAGAARIGAGQVDYEGDLRAFDGPVQGQVTVYVERLHRPGMRVAPAAINLSSTSFDPELEQRGMMPAYAVVHGQDDLLAARLVRQLAQAEAIEVERAAGSGSDAGGADDGGP